MPRVKSVWVHGAGGSHRHWPLALRQLAGRTSYALDLPGHGRSTGAGRASVSEYSAVLAEFAAALNLPPFVLVGHSMGGAIALDFALHRPTQLAGLVLISSGARLRVAPAILAGLQSNLLATTAAMVANMFGPAVSTALRRTALHRLRTVNPAVVQGDFAACDAFDLSTRLGEIRTPTLILCSTADVMTPPKYSERLHAALPNSTLHLLAHAGHMLMQEQPAAVAQLLEDFLTSYEAADRNS